MKVINFIRENKCIKRPGNLPPPGPLPLLDSFGLDMAVGREQKYLSIIQRWHSVLLRYYQLIGL
jgi:hypothetical protein